MIITRSNPGGVEMVTVVMTAKRARAIENALAYYELAAMYNFGSGGSWEGNREEFSNYTLACTARRRLTAALEAL